MGAGRRPLVTPFGALRLLFGDLWALRRMPGQAEHAASAYLFLGSVLKRFSNWFYVHHRDAEPLAMRARREPLRIFGILPLAGRHATG
jgi:hypothetical protein